MSNEFVVGSGLPRTGTASLAEALRILGYGSPKPVMHMFEVFKDDKLGKGWHDFFVRLKRDPDDTDVGWLLNGYRAGVDAPLCFAIPQVLKQHPNAKVIHTYRPGDEWERSTRVLRSVLSPVFGFLVYLVPPVYWQRQLAFAMFAWIDQFKPYDGLSFSNPELMDKHTQFIKETVPEKQLLLYRVQEGWEPLCKFLGKDVPDVPFPRVNDQNSVGTFIQGQVNKGIRRWLAVLVATIAVAYGGMRLKH